MSERPLYVDERYEEVERPSGVPCRLIGRRIEYGHPVRSRPIYRVKAGSRPIPVDFTDRLVQQGHALALWAGVVPEVDALCGHFARQGSWLAPPDE